MLANGGEASNIDDMQKIERLLQELKLRDEKERRQGEQEGNDGNRTEYLEEQEARNDEDLRMLLQEQDRIIKNDAAGRGKTYK